MYVCLCMSVAYVCVSEWLCMSVCVSVSECLCMSVCVVCVCVSVCMCVCVCVCQCVCMCVCMCVCVCKFKCVSVRQYWCFCVVFQNVYSYLVILYSGSKPDQDLRKRDGGSGLHGATPLLGGRGGVKGTMPPGKNRISKEKLLTFIIHKKYFFLPFSWMSRIIALFISLFHFVTSDSKSTRNDVFLFCFTQILILTVIFVILVGHIRLTKLTENADLQSQTMSSAEEHDMSIWRNVSWTWRREGAAKEII